MNLKNEFLMIVSVNYIILKKIKIWVQRPFNDRMATCFYLFSITYGILISFKYSLKTRLHKFPLKILPLPIILNASVDQKSKIKFLNSVLDYNVLDRGQFNFLGFWFNSLIWILQNDNPLIKSCFAAILGERKNMIPLLIT